ncbi:MAG: SGNH/GDSL hydrolase family protein [Armatimonadetes bacterium]|nr:SGNH/GDSL hydrolase family protein [Armatimonadota bacterium]
MCRVTWQIIREAKRMFIVLANYLLIQRRSAKVWLIALLMQLGCAKWKVSKLDKGAQTHVGIHKLAYVAIGASDTQAAGASSYEHGYVVAFHRYLEQATGRKWDFINVGRSGARITDVVERQLPLAIAVRPTVVSIWVGGNDVRHRIHPKGFERLLRGMLGTLREEMNAIVLIANLPEMERQPFARRIAPEEREFLRKQSRIYNDIIERAASDFGAILVDLRSVDEMYDERFFCSDGLHPNDVGYKRIAERFIEALKQNIDALRERIHDRKAVR